MHLITFLSIPFSFGAFAASMSADLPKVVSNTTTGDWKGIDGKHDVGIERLRKYFVRTDGLEVEPRDVICGLYSRLANIDGSFRSNPPSLDLLAIDGRLWESFIRKIDVMDVKCEQDHPGYEGEECSSLFEALVFLWSAYESAEIHAFNWQHIFTAQDNIGDVLTNPGMCGEGWKHGQKYIEMRESMKPEEKTSLIHELAV